MVSAAVISVGVDPSRSSARPPAKVDPRARTATSDQVDPTNPKSFRAGTLGLTFTDPEVALYDTRAQGFRRSV